MPSIKYFVAALLVTGASAVHLNSAPGPKHDTGMKGDEDLGMDMTIKGEKVHVVQKSAQGPKHDTGMKGDEDLGMDITIKGDKVHVA